MRSPPAALTMRFFLDKAKALNVGWNDRPLTEPDFYRLCVRHRVTVQEMPLRVSGFYYCVMGGHYIAIDSRLAPDKKLFVMFHEFAHYLMHAPDSGTTASFHGIGRKTRKEREADLFALVALIPRNWIANRTVFEISSEEGIDPETVAERFQIFKDRGI